MLFSKTCFWQENGDGARFVGLHPLLDPSLDYRGVVRAALQSRRAPHSWGPHVSVFFVLRLAGLPMIYNKSFPDLVTRLLES